MIDPVVIAEAAAGKLQVPAADLEDSATAALVYIANDISTTLDTLDPDDALVVAGAVLLCQRIYLDVPTRTGDLDALATVSFAGVVIPEDLGRHLRHYWIHAQDAWGVA